MNDWKLLIYQHFLRDIEMPGWRGKISIKQVGATENGCNIHVRPIQHAGHGVSLLVCRLCVWSFEGA